MAKYLGKTAVAVAVCGLLAAPWVQAEEGMWTFDNPPNEHLKARYGFEPDQKWLDHLRLASVRFMDGGSGSFASPAVGRWPQVAAPAAPRARSWASW